MVYNILNGDSLAYSFQDAKIEGNNVVVRECLIDGDLSGDNLYDFWQSRANYIGITETEYNNSVVRIRKNNECAFTIPNSIFGLNMTYSVR